MTDLQLTLLKDGEPTSAYVSNIEVLQQSILKDEEKPIIKEPEPEEKVGESLYKSNCKICHSAITISNGQTIGSLKNAFNRGDMKQFSGQFTDQQLEALVEYINTVVAP